MIIIVFQFPRCWCCCSTCLLDRNLGCNGSHGNEMEYSNVSIGGVSILYAHASIIYLLGNFILRICLFLFNVWAICQSTKSRGPSWSSLYSSWIYFNYFCNQWLSPLRLWVRIPLRRGVLDTTLCDKVYHWLATGRWFSPDTPVSSTDKTDRHDIIEILLKVALRTVHPTKTRKLNHNETF